MNVSEAIKNAEDILPGTAAPDGQEDPRWQAIIRVAEFIEDEPEIVWTFIERWGQHPDDDLRLAIATCLLEHLMDAYFDLFFPQIEQLAKSNSHFAQTVQGCSLFGDAELPNNAVRYHKLVREL